MALSGVVSGAVGVGLVFGLGWALIFLCPALVAAAWFLARGAG